MDDFFERYKKDLDKGYFYILGDKSCMKPDFIVGYPQKIAEKLKYDKRDSRTKKNKDKNKLSQLWRFYDHVRRIQDSLCSRNEPLEVLMAELYGLISAANYAYERQTITKDFKDFIDLNISHINNKKDLDAFIKHFQSLIAYLPKENQK